MKEYYDTRAPEYDDWWLGRGLFATASGPAGTRSSRELERRSRAPACADARRRLRDRVPHAASARRGRRARPERTHARRDRSARLPHATVVQGDALALPFRTTRFDRVFTSYFYCHLEEPDRLRFLAEARRVARELVVVAACSGDAEPHERWEERMLEDGSTMAGVQAVFDRDALASELRRRGAPRRATGSSSCARDAPTLSTARSPRSSATARLPRVRRGRLPARVAAGDRAARGQRAYMFGQAPGISKGEERRPWRGRAGQTLRRWLELDEDEFYATFYCASVTRCYPGRPRRGAATGRRRRDEQELCAFWRDWEFDSCARD